MSRNGPEPGAFVVEPVKNGWIVQHWPTEMEESPERVVEPPNYDPSAAFAESLETPNGMHTVAHVHLNGDEGPDPIRHVFQFSQMKEMLALVQQLTEQSIASPKGSAG